jgi:hypothetical protein
MELENTWKQEQQQQSSSSSNSYQKPRSFLYDFIGKQSSQPNHDSSSSSLSNLPPKLPASESLLETIPTFTSASREQIATAIALGMANFGAIQWLGSFL